MQLAIDVVGDESAAEDVFSLEDWIRNAERIDASVTEQPASRSGEEMGAEVLLSVVLAAPAIVELIKSIHVWIKTRHKTLQVKVTAPDGTVIDVSAESADDLAAAVESARSLAG